MNRCVKTWTVIPWGGMWHFKHPETGVIVSARNRDALMRAARKHAEANNLPIGLEFEQRVEELVCEALPGECVDCVDGKPFVKPILSIADVTHGTKVMLSFLMHGRRTVSPEEANRRAAICWSCPMRTEFPGGCGGGLCGELANMIVGVPATNINLTKQACGICHCHLYNAVWLELEDQCKGVTDAMRKEFDIVRQKHPCWKSC